MIVVAVDTTPWVPAVPTTDQHLLLVLPQPSVLQSRLLSSLSFRLFIVLPPLPPSTLHHNLYYLYHHRLCTPTSGFLRTDFLVCCGFFRWWWWGGVATAHIITTSTTSCTHKRRSDKENPQFCRHHSESVSPVGVSM